jgi:tetratricopeptide (TPR) repeat protein
MCQEETFLTMKIEEYKKLTLEIEKAIAINDLKKAQYLVDKYESEIENSSLFSYKAIMLFQRGDIEKAIQLLEDGIKKNPFSYSLYFNSGFMNATIKKLDKSLMNYFFAIKYSRTEAEKKEALNGIHEVSQLALKTGQTAATIQSKIEEYECILKQYDARVYPIDLNGVSLIRKPQQIDSCDEYMINMYKELNYSDINLHSRMLFKSELIKGSILRGKRSWNTTCPVVIPISHIDETAAITLQINGEQFEFTSDTLPVNQYHYIRISQIGTIEVNSSSPIFVGNPIDLQPIKKTTKLSLKIFIDGLSYEFLERNGFKEIMPNTYEFFKEGFISTNCYPTSEWTLPSKSSINTGVYATKHQMLQPKNLLTINKSYKLLAEYFKEQGYYCTNISTNWRTTPTLGYYRGFDRIIYQNFLGGMDCSQVVMETIEHLMSFDENNNFMTISLMDLHNVPDGFENHLYSQVNTDISNRIHENIVGSTSVQTKYDKNKIFKYREEIKRVDGILSVLYDFILKNYDENDIVVTLHSDHGQSFLEEEFNLLSDSRLKIPFMMRGKNIPKVISEELIESVDILPAILNSCEISVLGNVDGKLPKVLGGSQEREFTFTQIIHPNQTYKARINEKEQSYYFETKHLVQDDLTFFLEEYNSYILENETGKDLTKTELEKLAYYDQHIFNEIKNMLIWSN